jgi:hypothetical protein
LAAGKRMSKIKAAHQAMANPEATQAVNQAVESKLARAKNVHERITGRSTSPGFRNDPQNTGLSVESKPKSQAQSIQEKQEAKLSERVKSYREEANKPKKMSLPTIKKGRGEGEIAPVKRGASYGSVKQPFSPSKPKKMSLPTVLQGSGKGAMAPIRQGKSYGTVKEAAPNSPHVVNPVSSEIKNLTQSAKSFPGTKVDPESIKNKHASEKLISGMTGFVKQEKKQKKMSDFGKNVAAKVKAASAAGKEKHDQKPGLNPMDYKGASMFKHLKHAFSDKGPIGKAVNKVTGKYDKGFEKVVAPIEKGIKSGVSGVATGARKFGSAVKKVATSPTTAGLAKATAVHAGMALMHGTNYPRVMAQHAAQGPREFKPGWHGFTSPVEKPKAEEATDTKGERG